MYFPGSPALSLGVIFLLLGNRSIGTASGVFSSLCQMFLAVQASIRIMDSEVRFYE